jgi:hypothetical protein
MGSYRSGILQPCSSSKQNLHGQRLAHPPIDQLFLGKTDVATTTPSGKNVLVTISDGTGKAATAPGEELAVTTAHEMYGHGLLQLQGKAWEHDDHGPVDAAILTIEKNTRKTYEKNQQ